MTPGSILLFALSLAIIVLRHDQVWGEQTRIAREMLVAQAERAPGPTKGREDTPITIVEFSDFQCNFCRKFWKETLPHIEAEYISAGKVRFVYRHLSAGSILGTSGRGSGVCARAGEVLSIP